MVRIICFSLFLLTHHIQAKDIVNNDGKVYKDVKITKIQPDGLQIMHSSGIAFIKFVDLSPAIQKEYNFDREQYLKNEKLKKIEQDKIAVALTKKRALAKQKQLEYEKQKQLRYQKQKQLEQKIKLNILEKGEVYYFTQNKLYDMRGVHILYQYPHVDSICIAYGDYMLFHDKVYRIKNNAVPAIQKIKLIDTELNNLQNSIDLSEKSIDRRNRIIAQNIHIMKSILRESASSSTITFFNSKGELTKSITKEAHLNDAQKNLLTKINQRNINLNRENKYDSADIRINQKKIEELTKNRTILADEINKFTTEQLRRRKQAQESTNKTKEQSEGIEAKLVKLKELKDKGLIPEELYKEKVSKVMNDFLK